MRYLIYVVPLVQKYADSLHLTSAQLFVWRDAFVKKDIVWIKLLAAAWKKEIL